MSDPSYDVVAMSFPIVYTKDGDHDPDGLLFTLRAYEPLLKWARDRWEDDGEALPRLHERRQWIQLVVDGLRRYEEMLTKLGAGPAEDRRLVYDLGAEADVEARGEASIEDPRAAAVRQNFHATVDEIVAALAALTGGTVDRISPDPVVRASWLQQWKAALRDVDLAIAERLRRLDPVTAGAPGSAGAAAGPRRFDADALAAASGLTPERVRRLLLNDHRTDVSGLAEHTPPYDRFNPMRPIPLVRPLVLRACHGQEVEVRFENQIADRKVGMHLQGSGLGGTFPGGAAGDGVRFGDGAAVGRNDSTLVPTGARHTYLWRCEHEGVWPINDLGDVRGTAAGTNVHGLFAALVVEPAGATWRDPETGEMLTGTDFADGPYVDVIMPGERPGTKAHQAFVDFHLDAEPRSHREFTVFIHDEPEIHSGQHLVGEHTVMPLSYRAEPMPNRLPHRMRRYAEATRPEPAEGRTDVDLSAVKIEIDDDLGEVFWTARTPAGTYLERVAGEEQHHSSWLFGDPVTPIFRAYKGDPARIRLVHAGVKETHVFHLHVHQWRAVPEDTAPPSVWKDAERRGSQLVDSITIGPQTAVTIDPLYGSGSRQHAVGDVIWHCHLYPHFHHGMWGLWRSFDRWVDGLTSYPDGTPSHRLEPLPGRLPEGHPDRPDAATDTGRPGFPWFMDARFPQKSPPPPAIVDAHLVGRRRLLRMPLHSATELAAFAPGCRARPRSGALFVDLDGDAVAWNDTAELPPPRIVSYDVEVARSDVAYNTQGWHDRHGHHYRITSVTVTRLDENGDAAEVREFPAPRHEVEPFFPRANHGDIVELRLHNELGTIPADHFDLATPPVECGLHVHLVKFDVLAADGSSTGWNYLAGASCAEAVGPDVAGALPSNVGLHRWVVDEEFGPCFFHDHLLANYRQKHGLFAALIAEPFGSQWLRPDQDVIAWSGPEAVVTAPTRTGYESYREACLAVGDFVPLYGPDGKPLNPPHELSGDDDPGSMAVNYRCSPLTFRGDDPSQWFSGDDPDTPVVRTYPGERLRIRLIQGSHEEQHSFSVHGMRWRREWHNERSTLVDQQTVGISEAFTLEVGPLGPGDHLWHFAALDDLWLGCWGLVRVLTPGEQSFAELAPLPELDRTPAEALERMREFRAAPPRPVWLPDEGCWSTPTREFVVVARRFEHEYDGPGLTDPWGLVYEVADGWRDIADVPGRPRGRRRARTAHRTGEPLVLRARRGEWVRVTLINEVLTGPGEDPRMLPFGLETNPPVLPLEKVDEKTGYAVGRTVSPRVSLHPGLLRYDVVTDDGANVGRNHDGTAGTLAVHADGHGGAGHAEAGGIVFRDGHTGGAHGDPNWREYWWYADDQLAPDRHTQGPGQVCLLRDAADVRNHRHHGLVGALVVEPGDVTPVDPENLTQRWWGAHALIAQSVLRPDDDTPVSPGVLVANEKVLVVQDGLRLFVAGNPDLPVRDVVVGDDPEDAGQKGINYRAAMVHRRIGLTDRRPPTPLWPAQVGEKLWLRLVCAADKPRNHTFTVHGQAWKVAPWLDEKPDDDKGPWTGAVSGLTAATVHDLVLRATEPGDHAYRSGAFLWAVEQGMWGILRVEP
jgi:hypothetical protein